MSTEPDLRFRPSSSILQRRQQARRRLMIQRRRMIAFRARFAGHGRDRRARERDRRWRLCDEVRGAPGPRRAAVGRGWCRRSSWGRRGPRCEPRARVHAFVSHGDRATTRVALTFDDGPGPFTVRLVKTLRHLHVPATFFQVGQMVPIVPRRGPRCGASSRSATTPSRIPSSAACRSRRSARDRRRRCRACDSRTCPLRASSGRRTRRSTGHAAVLRGPHAHGAVDDRQPRLHPPGHEADRPARDLARQARRDRADARRRRRPQQTIAALPSIVKKLRRRHFRFVTVAQMLKDDPPPHDQPLPPGRRAAARAADRQAGIRGGRASGEPLESRAAPS